MEARTHQSFKIRTLRDIYELPTQDMMERALAELGKMMSLTRATDDLMGRVARDLAKSDGKELPENLRSTWPEEVEWIDDDGDKNEARFVGPEGENLLILKLGKSDA